MTQLETRMEAIRTSLAAAVPERIVTRAFKPLQNVPASELQAGQYTIISRGESGYQNLNGREAMDGTHRVLIVGRFQLPEDASGLDIEQTEFEMLDEWKAWLRALPDELCCFVLQEFEQSGQVEQPYGWIAGMFAFLGDE